MSSETIYDYPLYYDILFSWDRSQEVDFYEAAFRCYGVAQHEPVLEVACGPGQVARRLAKRGWALTGFDRQEAMVAYLRERAAEDGQAIEVVRADMVDFRSSRSFGAAYNPMSSFRLLHETAEVDAHLRVMARALRPGGIYVLDMDFLGAETDEVRTTDEEWEMTRGGVSVQASDEAVFVNDDGVRRTIAWGDEVHLHGYTAQTLIDRVDASGSFAIEAWHPEFGRGAEGISQFSVDKHADLPAVGRTMVVLRRTSRSRPSRAC